MTSEAELLSLISQVTFLGESTDSYSERGSTLASLICQIVPLVSSMDLDSFPKPESEVISLIKKTISLFKSLTISEPESELVSLIKKIISLGSSRDSDSEARPDEKIIFLVNQVTSYKPEPEIISLIYQVMFLVTSMNMSLRSKVLSLISQLLSICSRDPYPNQVSEISSVCKQMRSLSCFTDLDSQPKPDPEAISLFKQIISVASSVSDSDPEYKLISLFYLALESKSEAEEADAEVSAEEEAMIADIQLLITREPKPELMSLILQICNLASLELKQFVSLCPQVEVKPEEGKLRVAGKVQQRTNEKGECYRRNMDYYKILTRENVAYFRCPTCNGEDHEEYVKASLEVKHFLHQKHSLHLVLLRGVIARKCYCCEEYLAEVFYYFSICDYAMNVDCFKKNRPISIEHPKWHEDSLYLFPRQASLTCNVCALTHSRCPFYICPPCEFVVHQRCLNLPRVIKISRHLHRISFIEFLDQGDRSCGVCRKEIDCEYGCYSCAKHGCSYAAHSRCATQSNVWDGIELEGVPEEIEEEEVGPFVRISDGIIHHFSHQQQHLRLSENKGEDYNENKECQACIMPIYYGKFYSCMQCEFILHEACANLPRKVHHPVHAHPLILVTGDSDVIETRMSLVVHWFLLWMQ